jgi:NAD+ diphosphatase
VSSVSEPRHTFAGGTLDRAAHIREDEAALSRLSEARSTRFLPFRDLKPLLRGEDILVPAWQAPDRVLPLLEAGAVTAFLGLEEDAARFVVDVPGDLTDVELEPPDATYTGVRRAAPFLSPADASVVAFARSLLAWHDVHRYCPSCGAPAESAQAGHQKRCTDDACGVYQFPRTDPVVIMLVHREDRCLLGRAVRARRYPAGLYSCLAGYVEPGESIEEAVRREVLEEAGLEVARVRYHSSQPWPFPSTLMIGCFAEALPGQVRIDPAELESARWFTLSELREAVERWMEEGTLRLPPPLTIAHQLARAWLSETV